MNISESINSGSTTNFNLSALQASEILTGGFNAEYGNIRSGIINVVTKEGSSDYHFNIDLKRSSTGRSISALQYMTLTRLRSGRCTVQKQH
jgi:hypothetical protein